MTADAASFSVNGVTFSDRLGGFVLEKVAGEGSMDYPFVLIERMTLGISFGWLTYVATLCVGVSLGLPLFLARGCCIGTPSGASAVTSPLWMSGYFATSD